MICLEQAMLCPGMSGYLNDRFDRTALKAMSSVKIGPLTLIDVSNFEDLLPDMNTYGFATLLEAYYRAHLRLTHDQLVAFRRKYIPFLDDKPEHANDTEAAFRRFFAELGARLFQDVG
jgi:hypothetical protein